MVSIRRRRNHKERSVVVDTSIPEGWALADHVKPDGEVVKCYTNVISQKFFTMDDLLRYVNYAKRKQISIYTPGFDPLQLPNTCSDCERFIPNPDTLDSREQKEAKEQLTSKSNYVKGNSETKRRRLNEASTSDATGQAGESSRKRKSRSISQISHQIAAIGEKLDEGATASYEGKGRATYSSSRPIPLRGSRRLAGYEPEIVPDLSLRKAPEYIHAELKPEIVPDSTPQKAPELETKDDHIVIGDSNPEKAAELENKDDHITSEHQGDKLAGSGCIIV